jgi:hypothetical protein
MDFKRKPFLIYIVGFQLVKVLSLSNSYYFLKMYLEDGLALSSLTVGSLLMPLESWKNNLNIAPMDLKNSTIQPMQTQTLPFTGGLGYQL